MKHPRAFVKTSLSVAAVGLMGGALALSFTDQPSDGPGSSPLVKVHVPKALQVLAHVGCSPEALAAAGVSASQISTLVQHAAEADDALAGGTDDTGVRITDAQLNAERENVRRSLTADQRQKLDLIRENSAWSVPIEYKVVRRSESEWVSLRDRLIQARQNGQALAATGADEPVQVLAARQALGEKAAIEAAINSLAPVTR